MYVTTREKLVDGQCSAVMLERLYYPGSDVYKRQQLGKKLLSRSFSFWGREILFQAVDLGQNGGGFILQRRFQGRVVSVGHLARLVLKVEIPQVFVDGILAFAQITGAGFFWPQKAVSYTHLDVYKRQRLLCAAENSARFFLLP